jgi:hypothetical protein
MSCDDKSQAFKDKLASVQAELQAELASITEDTERKAQEISDDFDAGNDLAAGIGAAAGTVIGAAAGPGGAALGGVIGRVIGGLFTLEIGTRRETVSLDVPETTMKTQDMSFDLPTVELRDTDVSFDLPAIEMRRERGPDIPEFRTRMEQRCVDLGPLGRPCTDVPVTYIEMVPTYYDLPMTVMRTQRIVVGMPVVVMQRQDIKLDLPEISMKTTEFSADIPFVTLRFLRDAGARTAALAAALAQSAQDAAINKQVAFRERLKQEVAPLASSMFACFRDTITTAKVEAASRFESQLATLTATLTNLVSRGVPDTDNDYVQTKAQLTDLLTRRDALVQSFDAALQRLSEQSATAMAQFLGTPAEVVKSKGGLLSVKQDTAKAPAQAPKGTRIRGLVDYLAATP